MEYIKHLIMLKWDLFMLDFYTFLFVIGVFMALFTISLVFAFFSGLKKASKKKAVRRNQEQQARSERKSALDKEALRNAEMKT